MSNVDNSILSLQEHQEDAYENTEKLFEDGRYAAVIFPTGCGKSFVTLKYILEHPDQKILFLSPRCAIKEQMYEYIVRYIGGRINDSIEEVKEEFGSMENAAQSFIPGFKAALYQSVLKIGEGGTIDEIIEKTKPDLIVIDEMHHLKTKRNKSNNVIEEDEESLSVKEKVQMKQDENEWGRKFQELLDRCPDTKVLGLSATPIRTDGANVVDRIFNNSIASEISLLEAMEDGIIVPPKYIIPDFLIKEEKELMLKRIERVTGELKERLQEEYNELVKKSDEAPGIPELMDEHITEKNGKYIVFCKDIKDMEEKQAKAKEWFGKIDEEPTIYRVSSKHNDSQEQLDKFNNDESEHLKIMYCVGMIDEGVHLNNVSGVILAAKTGSRPTYLQRLGRAISSGKDKKKALVLDLVNNYEILYENREFSQNIMTDLEALENTKLWMTDKNLGQYPMCLNESLRIEQRYAKRLKRLKNKYEKYIKNPELLQEIDSVRKEEINEIIYAGNEIDLWKTDIVIEKIEDELEEENLNDNSTDPGIFDNLEIKGAKKRFQQLLKEVNYRESTYEEVIKFLNEHDGKMMKGSFQVGNDYIPNDKLTESQIYEKRLYHKWIRSMEKKILDEYEGRNIEEVPEEYREKIIILRSLIKKKMTTYEEVMKFLEEHDRKMMHSNFKKGNKCLTVEELTPEQIYETNLYKRWRKTEEKKILDEYEGRNIEEIPEEYIEKIRKLRKLGVRGKKKKIDGQNIGQAGFSSSTGECDNADEFVKRITIEKIIKIK